MTQTGRIYKIESDCGSVLYIGSTVLSLNNRFRKHKQSKIQNCVIFKYLFDPDYTFSKGCELIKEYKVIDRRHLLAYEQLYINKFKHCVNQKSPLNLLKKQKQKKYREENRESISNRMKEYYKAIGDKRKDYYNTNRECILNKAKAYSKEYYEKNRESISNRMKEYYKSKVLCECGSNIRRGNLFKHKKTNKHNDYIYGVCKEVLEDIISLI